jgi:hypothetical protein
MSNNSQFQMVEIDQNPFAVEIRNGNIGVNLTQMARPFGKKPKDWLRSNEAKEYIAILTDVQKCPSTDLIEVRRGGTIDEQGTWAYCHLLSIRFAQWLDKRFAIAVDALILKLLTGELCVFNPADFETGLLPKLIHYGDIFLKGTFYNYIELLKACGLSISRGSVRRRVRKNPQEFLNNKINGALLVSERYGKAIYANSISMKFNSETRTRRLTYEAQQALPQA